MSQKLIRARPGSNPRQRCRAVTPPNKLRGVPKQWIYFSNKLFNKKGRQDFSYFYG